MTNKEEMQSLNEELMTLNLQYLSKTEELSQAASDMKNLLDATEIATIFLDNAMVIKRFTPRVHRIVPLLPADVGRPITHFAHTLRHAHLAQDVQQVLDRLATVEASIQTTQGEWYAMRILPYRTLNNYISGAVITFTDITALKTLEAQLQESARFAESIVETLREPLLVLDAELYVLGISRAGPSPPCSASTPPAPKASPCTSSTAAPGSSPLCASASKRPCATPLRRSKTSPSRPTFPLPVAASCCSMVAASLATAPKPAACC